MVIGNGADAVTEIGHAYIQPIEKLGTNPPGLAQCIGYGIDHNIDTVGRGGGGITATSTTCTHIGIVAANRRREDDGFALKQRTASASRR